MYSTEDYYTKEYVKSVKEGKFAIKPSHMESGEREISEWIESGRNMPEELDRIQGQKSWDRDLGVSRSFCVVEGSIVPYIVLTGVVLCVAGVMAPALAPVAITGINVAKFTVLTAGAYGFEKLLFKE